MTYDEGLGLLEKPRPLAWSSYLELSLITRDFPIIIIIPAAQSHDETCITHHEHKPMAMKENKFHDFVWFYHQQLQSFPKSPFSFSHLFREKWEYLPRGGDLGTREKQMDVSETPIHQYSRGVKLDRDSLLESTWEHLFAGRQIWDLKDTKYMICMDVSETPIHQ